ncbi:hypothetical protein C1J03_05390 [Sulfitobacter sp. SK012]|nr:hypothetical protein C1J03_05390 [Sulfitobacter sp. SK012]
MINPSSRNGSSAEEILSKLLNAQPEPTRNTPKDQRGIYGLVDHFGDLRYIGSTASLEETFYKRIHQRHRTGSEDSSHYFSRMYNTGRMWRLRNDPSTKTDGDISKKLRNAFVAEYCTAVWVPMLDSDDIPRLEKAVIAIAPQHATAWNNRGMGIYDEPVELVDKMLSALGFSNEEVAAIDRQNTRFIGMETELETSFRRMKHPVQKPSNVPPFPKGPFRFIALDVETANNDRGSICQIGVACVRPDNSIETWVTYIDPQTTKWVFSYLHGIDNETVAGAACFEDVLPVLKEALQDHVVYQHSGFDRSAIAAACRNTGQDAPSWNWKDSVQVARNAWPELKGNGGHGLGSLKKFLGLTFEHHDAGEDARAAAEVVLYAEGKAPLPPADKVLDDDDRFDVIENDAVTELSCQSKSEGAKEFKTSGRIVGRATLTQGSIKNNYIKLTSFFSAFPRDAVGGSNAAQTASRAITVDWGGHTPEVTDLDGKKKFFRTRSWVREFFERNGVEPGDTVTVKEVGSYRYRVFVDREQLTEP